MGAVPGDRRMSEMPAVMLPHLVGATHLHLDASVAIQVQEVGRLQRLVAELGE